MEIADAPRFPWRGLLLDPARRFLPLSALLRTLDAMAACKLNVLHLHLTDDQGFRFPSTRFPALPAQGGQGQFYRAEELQTLVARAADLGIRVVPELDMPGHCSSWLLAYPAWSAGPAPTTLPTGFGVHPHGLHPAAPVVQAAIDVLLAEVTALFPDAYVHIGGDEVDPACWQAVPELAADMQARGLSSLARQHEFNAQLAQRLQALGRRLMGWDEILAASLPADALVQSWRGAAMRDLVVAQGRDLVVSQGYYLDLMLPADLHYLQDPAADAQAEDKLTQAMLADPRLAHVRDGLRWWQDFTRQAAAQQPTPAPAAQPGRLLGAEACLWGELVAAPQLDTRLWSRLPALAERFWSVASLRDLDFLYQRLPAVQARLAYSAGLDLAAAQAQQLVALGVPLAAQPELTGLLQVLEPIKWYARLLGPAGLAARAQGLRLEGPRPYDTQSPLDQLVDLLPPESLWCRELSVLLQAWLAGEAVTPTLLAVAADWQQQPRRLAALCSQAPALRVAQPLAGALAALGNSLTQLLQADSPSARQVALTQLTRQLAAAQPRGELVLAVVPVLTELVAAARQRWSLVDV